MNYQDAMILLSQCGLGAVLMLKDGQIIEINERGDALLHGEGDLVGKKLGDVAPRLAKPSRKTIYESIAFGEYLARSPAPEVTGLPDNCTLAVFRDATSEASQDMLSTALNCISEAVIISDEQCRVFFVNDAAVKMDSIVSHDVLGEHITDIYSAKEEELIIPRVVRSLRPALDQRQSYTTRYGKAVDIVSNNFPITQNGQILGAFSVMEDWSSVDELHKQVLDLQEKLVARSDSTKQDKDRSLSAKYHFRDINYTSSTMGEVIARCKQVARSDSSVMIYGETGTGKELFAQSIHNASRRSDHPFLAINCAAIPENLLEGLLFGTEKGAYTGAESRSGLFEQANGGTLLLDELNSMNISLQSKLLRVLQDGMIRRVGGVAETYVDVRVLSNINIPPHQAIEENKLRQDLFYRLGVVNINIPPLRERKEDIPLLAKNFILRCNRAMVKNVKDLDRTTLNHFYAYNWPGNVRELQHAIEHAMNILPDELSVITSAYVPEHIIEAKNQAVVNPQDALLMKHSLNSTIKDLERRTICEVLKENGGNVSKSARVLGMGRQNLQYRIKRYNIDVEALLTGDDEEDDNL